MAAKINPLSKQAKDGMTFLQGYMFRKEEARKADDVKRRGAIEEYGALGTAIVEEGELKQDAASLRESLGITLNIKDGFPVVGSILKNSAAYEAGMKKDDILVSVWGKLTGYMSQRDVFAILLEKASLEQKCVIERTVSVRKAGKGGIFSSVDGLIGANFAMELDGLTISSVKDDGPAKKSGLFKGDLIAAIDGKPTRYMPINKAVELVKSGKNSNVKLTFRREITLWRR
jgi:C-terminal processing protease CtpA/Prc